MKHLRLGTRRSELALWQSRFVASQLKQRWGDEIEIELVEIVTEGDRILDRPLAEVGGKGLFVSGIEAQLLRGELDFAVHSLKDMPAVLPDGLALAATPERASPFDALCGPENVDVTCLPAGFRIGTSSLRRAALLRRFLPQVEVISVRGNVATRLRKIEEGVVDAVVLAKAGLDRLGLGATVRHVFQAEQMLPAASQGILAIEARQDDADTLRLLAPLEDPSSRVAAQAERSFLRTLEGGCQVPMACYAKLVDGDLHVSGLVIDPAGTRLLQAFTQGAPQEAVAHGETVAARLLDLGAAEILRAHG